MGSIRVGACQTEEILGDVGAAVRAVHEFAGRPEAAGVDLLLFPECFLQGYLVTAEHVRGQALEIGSPEWDEVLARLAGIRPMLVLGMIERAGDVFHNTAVVISGRRLNLFQRGEAGQTGCRSRDPSRGARSQVEKGSLVGRYRKIFLTGGESIFTPGAAYPVFDAGQVRFGINICSDTRFPVAAAGVAAGGASLLLVPAQNMMRREKAFYWRERHNRIRTERVRETGMWLISADVTGERDPARIGLGPTCVIDPAGRVVARVPSGTTGIAVADVRNG